MQSCGYGQFVCDPYQFTHTILYTTRTNNLKIYMELKMIQNWKKKKCGGYAQTADKQQTTIQNYSNQNSVVLAQKQVYRSIE